MMVRILPYTLCMQCTRHSSGFQTGVNIGIYIHVNKRMSADASAQAIKRECKRMQREFETKPAKWAVCVCALELRSAFFTARDQRDCFELQKGQPERLNNLQENCIYSACNLHRTQLGLWINSPLPVVHVPVVCRYMRDCTLQEYCHTKLFHLNKSTLDQKYIYIFFFLVKLHCSWEKTKAKDSSYALNEGNL